ncbi:MAG: class II aldolase/adducin family protein [Myxococcales bacterium]|nr:class II aldolase/adducin family protein [Myxococcales bacterium]
MTIEGVTRFVCDHTARPLPARRFGEVCAPLAGWRTLLAELGLVGRDPARYGGVGYGNVSARVGPFPGGRGARAFVISGTGTGERACAGLDDFALVRRYDIARNRVESEGGVAPSSESMTHGAIYDLSPQIRVVLHAHAPVLWRAARALKLPTTAPAVEYGTPEMAREVARLARETTLFERRALAMGGHEDGIIAFGRDADTAGQALMAALAAAHALAFQRDGAACATRPAPISDKARDQKSSYPARP